LNSDSRIKRRVTAFLVSTEAEQVQIALHRFPCLATTTGYQRSLYSMRNQSLFILSNCFCCCFFSSIIGTEHQAQVTVSTHLARRYISFLKMRFLEAHGTTPKYPEIVYQLNYILKNENFLL
jgi:hypothetical protein